MEANFYLTELLLGCSNDASRQFLARWVRHASLLLQDNNSQEYLYGYHAVPSA